MKGMKAKLQRMIMVGMMVKLQRMNKGMRRNNYSRNKIIKMKVKNKTTMKINKRKKEKDSKIKKEIYCNRRCNNSRMRTLRRRRNKKKKIEKERMKRRIKMIIMIFKGIKRK